MTADLSPAERILTDRAISTGATHFGEKWNPDFVVLAPGRIELLGNHLDYNGGPVLAAAIDRQIAVVLHETPDMPPTAIQSLAADFDERVDIADVPSVRGWTLPAQPQTYTSYLNGVIAAILERDFDLRLPQRFVVAGNLPAGLGISSSAALCVALVTTLSRDMLRDHDVVLLAQEAEHRAGTPCGTMDQSASVAGGVIHYQAEPLHFDSMKPDLGPYIFAVIDSGVERSLNTSRYPQRVQECAQLREIASAILAKPVPHLCGLGATDVQRITSTKTPVLTNTLRRRLNHIVTETERVRQGISALEANDWHAFGNLMIASGRSSAQDYEISHPQVEELVSDILALPGVLGARMMGGGDGGAVLVLLEQETTSLLSDTLRDGYFARHPLPQGHDQVLRCTFATGVRTIAL